MQEVVTIEKWDRGDMWKENNSIEDHDEKAEKNQIFFVAFLSVFCTYSLYLFLFF